MLDPASDATGGVICKKKAHRATEAGSRNLSKRIGSVIDRPGAVLLPSPLS